MSDPDDEIDVTELLRRPGVAGDDFRIVGSTHVVYEPEKETRNRKDHGYSLESTRVFLEQFAFPFAGNNYPMRTFYEKREGEEVRHVHFGRDETGTYVRFVTTMRSPEVVRVISFRRAQRKDFEKLRQLFDAM